MSVDWLYAGGGLNIAHMSCCDRLNFTLRGN